MTEQYNSVLGRVPTQMDRAWLTGFQEAAKQSADINNNPYKSHTPESGEFMKGFDNYMEYFYES
jgi:hypothetical protein